MWQSLKIRKLAGQLRGQDSHEAYAAVMELGRISDPRVVQLLAQALRRRDGLARAAARELGRLKAVEAVRPLVENLEHEAVAQSAADALAKIGGAAAVDALAAVLRSGGAKARRAAAETLGQLGDRRAVEHLARLAEADAEYDVRVAAVASLGLLKDPRGVWVLVNILKLRDESGEERRAGLERLRAAAQLAMRRIGDPLAGRPEVQAASAAAERSEAGLHPKLAGDPSELTIEEVVGVLRELVQASEEISWAGLERREPLLAGHFATYALRHRTAEILGEELNRRGGRELAEELLRTKLGNNSTLRNWWGY